MKIRSYSDIIKFQILPPVGSEEVEVEGDTVELLGNIPYLFSSGVIPSVDASKNIDAGLVTLYESHALYAEGVFGTIPEFYVRPEFRSHGVGLMLLDSAKKHGISKGWKRLEVATPPVPAFDRTLKFYEANGFTNTGGRKLKVIL